ncbi:lysophospholipid acyltransferase family protein [Paenibacillus mucilaginosus]|uniref:lysophospholipid acyltransferase family protein n=1 Tax=Paenibacillus mucilaginosus TaxID=61624 RepID=UPI0002F926AD|nr:lysophospholipid acyltransferase family protein [Paenibacillus mucilaginosus]
MVYWIIRNAVKLWLYLRFRIQVKGVRHIPEGGCILAMNHRSNYDSLLVGVHTPRKMHIMAKEELFRSKLGAWVITEMGAFPVKRGSCRSAFPEAFPEADRRGRPAFLVH